MDQPADKTWPNKVTVEGYMCRIDWDCELGSAADGNKVFPSIDCLKKHHPMASECGIVKVRVDLLDVIEEGDVL